MTAVEWLEKEFVKLEHTIGVHHKMYELLEQAKEMEKKQIIDAWIATDNELQRMAAEQYYTSTYGSKGSEHHIVDTNEMVSSQTEISDEEILKQGNYLFPNLGDIFRKDLWEMGAKWYREQLKQRQNG